MLIKKDKDDGEGKLMDSDPCRVTDFGGNGGSGMSTETDIGHGEGKDIDSEIGDGDSEGNGEGKAEGTVISSKVDVDEDDTMTTVKLEMVKVTPSTPKSGMVKAKVINCDIGDGGGNTIDSETDDGESNTIDSKLAMAKAIPLTLRSAMGIMTLKVCSQKRAWLEVVEAKWQKTAVKMANSEEATVGLLMRALLGFRGL
jgi:hypothetical protein